MTDELDLNAELPKKPALPLPTRQRWQPLRIGLIELFHYDSEEFWFHDGHLLLRGNNGTGKSKVLSLTLPFLLDAQLKPSRIEPDGDAGKKMAWNLLMNSYDRRIGYAWIEFGRVAEDGTPHYLTLGAGLSAAAARPQVEPWFFMLEDSSKAPRINQDIWLINAQHVVLTKDRLRDALEGHGQVFPNAMSYRRAVDERLFHLGEKRYEALMDTLIQLRQPQLSKKPDETGLSNALTESLPPLSSDLLGDVAQALGQLEEDRHQLEEFQTLAKAVDRFDQRYRNYASTQSRRQARVLRQAQTEFDNASRSRTEAQDALDAAVNSEILAKAAHDSAELALTGQRARLDTLRSDPTMQDANRLESAEKDAFKRRQAVEKAATALDNARGRVQQAASTAQRYALRVTEAERVLSAARNESAVCANVAGMAGFLEKNQLFTMDGDALVELPQRAIDTAQSDMRAAVAGRRGHIGMIRRLQSAVATAATLYSQQQQIHGEKLSTFQDAAERREQADANIETEAELLVRAWVQHFSSLVQLQLTPEPLISALVDWAPGLQGDNPAQHALQVAHQQTSRRLAAQRSELDGKQQQIRSEQQLLEAERAQLEAGVDVHPPSPYTRGSDVRSDRIGAPLWQLVEFRDFVIASQRAGLEAALEAAGLLDAWVTPDGKLEATDGEELLQDTQILLRASRDNSLSNWLQACTSLGSAVTAQTVERLLAGIGCGESNLVNDEAWVSPDGQFRLGALAGRWIKPDAVYIGFAARSAARARRLAEISVRIAQLSGDTDVLQEQFSAHAMAEQKAAAEWLEAPKDQSLRNAHLAAASCAREYQMARDHLTLSDTRCKDTESAWNDACKTLARDAIDLRLPEMPEALLLVEESLSNFNEAQHHLLQAARELRQVVPEFQQRKAYEGELREDYKKVEENLAVCRLESEEASAQLDVLREAVGAKVDELKQKLRDAIDAVSEGEGALGSFVKTLRICGEARAVAREKATTAEGVFLHNTEVRMQVVSKFQQFVATGLLSSALPQAELPDMNSPWTIDPALTLARRVEQALADIKDDEDAWLRVQRQISEEYTELQRALTALGHQAIADSSDWGLVVQIVYQNRPERPDRLSGRLAEEIAQRSELLTANERAVLENHLQAEIAAEVQRLLQSGEKQVEAINKELYKRPTSTGVRYRLVWQQLTEEEGAPVGLDAARKRLLNTSADLWSVEDRKVVGAMLQQKIAAERERADSGIGNDGGGSLLDQLARALDYRRWHRFRVERWQGGDWRKLSGPASSGERALGLTVPLFAAVASFYSQGNYNLAPRLMLLDEAFAGIDDAARAHCMGLIREFDLDFVITSEREWACYAELPGVAICQLLRREGVDAIFVSRWTWDGKAKKRDPDPDRRFGPI
jgi:uncharacterized protein (TIGR02680 family)